MQANPIIYKDSTATIKNPRQDLLEEGIDRIKGNRGMIIKGFKTEKMRVEEHLRNVNFYYPKVARPPSTKDTKTKITQPSMRFKPRTDMERVFEAINKAAFRKLDKNIIKKQLKKNKENLLKKEEEKKDEIPDYKEATKENISEYDDFDYLGLNVEKSDNFSQLERERTNKLIKTRKTELNKHAKYLMREFHDKTHFKGVTSLMNMTQSGKKFILYI